MLKYSSLLLFLCLLPVYSQQEPSSRLGDAPVLPQTGSKEINFTKSAAAPMAIPASWYDISTRAASQAAYLNDYVPTTGIPMGWTGSIGANNPGDTSLAWKQAVMNRVNFYRAMAGVPANLVLDSTLNMRAQGGALMMAANNMISHCIGTSCTGWQLYTPDRAATLSSSNVCQSYFSTDGTTHPTDPGCVSQYIADQGTNNEVVGHRRWILYSRQRQIGTGDVFTTYTPAFNLSWNALYVLDTASFLNTTPATRDGFIAWPPKGYVPYQLVPPRWSFAVPGNADLSTAVVKVTKNGVTTTQTLAEYATGYGDNTIIFNPEGRGTTNSDPASGPPPVADTVYTVSVENVKVNNAVQPAYTYNVVVFDPAVTSTTGCSPSITTYTGSSGYQNVKVDVSGGGCGTWNVSSGANWAGVYPQTGSGTGSFTITIYPNFSSGTRNTTVTVGGKTIAISQPTIGGTANERFVQQLYFYALGRMPEQWEIALQVQNGLTNGRAALANTFMQSPEFNGKSRYIAGLYLGLLGRDAEYTGWIFQRNALLNGIAGKVQLVTNFLNAAEYSLKYGAQSNEQFVRMLYSQVLLRQPSQDEVNLQVNALAGWNRVAMASGFLDSPEFALSTGPRLLAFLYYAALLNRDPNPAELSATVAALTNAGDAQRIVVLNQILNSQEFLSSLQ